MKNKLISLLLAVFCLLFVGCSQSEDSANKNPEIDTKPSEMTHEELFDKVMAEASVPTSAHLKMYSLSEMILSDDSLITNVEHEIKYDMREEDNIKYQSISSSTTPLLAEAGIVEIYYLDGYFYTQYGDTKMKSKVEEDVAFPKVDYSSAQFKAEDLLDFSVEEKEELYHFTYSVKEEALPQHIKEIEQIHGLTEGIEFITASGETVISKDGKILESDITIEVKVETPALTGTIITNTYTEYYSINEDIEIIYPENLEDFIEY